MWRTLWTGYTKAIYSSPSPLSYSTRDTVSVLAFPEGNIGHMTKCKCKEKSLPRQSLPRGSLSVELLFLNKKAMITKRNMFLLFAFPLLPLENEGKRLGRQQPILSTKTRVVDEKVKKSLETW